MLRVHEKFYINSDCLAMNKNSGYSELSQYFSGFLADALKYSSLL